jgi:hypothetical protein
MKQFLLLFTLLSLLFSPRLTAQQNLVTYCNGSQESIFNDVFQLSNADILALVETKDLSWVSPNIPKIQLTATGITNTTVDGSISAIFLFNTDATILKKVFFLPANTAMGFRFIKTDAMPRSTTGGLYVSGETSEGYFIGKLNNNFINGEPTDFIWVKNVGATAGAYPKLYQPWDVGTDGKVVYAYGDSHSSNWSAIERLKADGTTDVVANWRTHWSLSNLEYNGIGADYPGATGVVPGVAGLSRSAIVFKRDTRCNLRSQNSADFDTWSPDGNGGTKKGKWPMDVVFSTHGTVGSGPTSGPGYTGYRPATSFTFGPSSIVINKLNNDMVIGFNFKSVLPDGNPDFEPAVMTMSSSGALKWWSRLYHEKRADGSLHNSSPDQYIDDLAIDYTNNYLVVAARCHGNNVENFWEGNTLSANPSASGFQNSFTGSGGNFHIGWLGKLKLLDGTIMHSTYLAEFAQGATGLGAAHPDPNLDGWPNPNNGWPTLNTTREVNNTMKVTSDGSVLVIAKGRRTITTANAYQKMPLPSSGLLSAWNSFVRLYNPQLSSLTYSSLLVGNWDKTLGTGGDNVTINGVFKTNEGILIAGNHSGTGAELPLSNVPNWGKSNFSATTNTGVFAYLKTTLLQNANDGFLSNEDFSATKTSIKTFPNPYKDGFNINFNSFSTLPITINIYNVIGQMVESKKVNADNLAETVFGSNLNSGVYVVELKQDNRVFISKAIKTN